MATTTIKKIEKEQAADSYKMALLIGIVSGMTPAMKVQFNSPQSMEMAAEVVLDLYDTFVASYEKRYNKK